MARELCCLCLRGRFEAEGEPGVGRIVESRSPGMTPRICVGCPSTFTVWPTTSGRPAARSLPHRVAEHHGGRGARLLVGSQGSWPNTGLAPSAARPVADIRCPSNRCAGPVASPARLADRPASKAPTASKAALVLSRRRSTAPASPLPSLPAFREAPCSRRGAGRARGMAWP